MTHLPDSPHERLIARLAGHLGQSIAVDFIEAMVQATGRSDLPATVIEVLDELQGASSKAAQGAMEALPELRRRVGLELVVPWLDLGVALAGSSGTAAMKYVKESPLILGLIQPIATQARVLTLALELADSDPNVALDFFRKAPELLTALQIDELGAWAEVGVELARFDYVLGIEFFRQSPAVARVIPLEQVRDWVRFGMKLITQNSLGKPDYLGTLEFFRTSAAILGDVQEGAVRKQVIAVGSVLADRDPKSAISFLAESPTVLRRVPSAGWQLRLLQYGALVAERDAEAALAYLRRCPEVLALLGTASDLQRKFEDWFRGGMEIVDYSIEGARAYFSMETKKALASVEQAMSGVPLRQVARSLKLFAQGLCGIEVTIQSLPETITHGEPAKEPARATVSANGQAIALPALLSRYPTRDENIRLYTVMTAHEAGHLEFGTYSLQLSQLADLTAEVRSRYGRPHRQQVATLAQVFSLYPQPGLIRDLWTVLEDARVEYRLQQEYPGLRSDLARLGQEAVTTRSLLHGLSVRELVVDALLLRSTAEPGRVRVPDSIAVIVEQAWALCQTILTPTATAEDAIRVADRIYVVMEEMIRHASRDMERQGEPMPEMDLGVGPKASEETSGIYRPVTNWAYRGTMNPELVTDRGRFGQEGLGDESGSQRGTQTAEEPAQSHVGLAPGHTHGHSGERRGELSGGALVPGVRPATAVEQMQVLDHDQRGRHETERSRGRAFLYDEWDGVIQDYRSGWCRVAEWVAPEGSSDFVETTLTEQGPAVRLLRRYFESLRPQGLRRVYGLTDGEELDLNALVRRAADLAAGVESSDRVYVSREKRERDVAVVFLVDMSGSTSRQIESGGRRVIDVEKEGLALLCEALEAVGDQYAIYGYSGQGRHQVDFVILKDFDESARGRAAQRIGAAVPLHQNRDGAAIRHAARKLLARHARTRLLVLISDGKPLDDGYTDEYSLQDTKMALREVSTSGIHPFCITVDRDADDYLRRMYGEVRYLVIDNASALPERLPRVYRRLTT
ncbi:MAG: VWA domain-containing protein [Nitrospirae bacterium]|nr:MAG: VWA domain-containing protein [Nitrospirota bacterium]